MIINNKHKFIFIHLPKTGGGSLTNFLLSSVNGSVSHQLTGDDHSSIGDIKNIKTMYNDYYKFMVIRNPWDYYTSLYEYGKRRNCHEWRLFNYDNSDFNTWVKRIVNCETNNEILSIFKNDNTSTSVLYKFLSKYNMGCGWLTHRYIYSAYIDWPNIIKNKKLEYLLNTPSQIGDLDGVFKLKNINTDILDKLSKSTNIGVDILKSFSKQPRKNVSVDKKHYSEYYNEETKNLIYNKEKFIIEEYNYSF